MRNSIYMKTLTKLGWWLVGLYMVACVGLYFLQDLIIFRPQALPEGHQFREGMEVDIPVEDGISLNALWIREARAKGVILYLHGNRGSNRRCLRQTRGMQGLGYDIFMPDYRGYGKSDGAIYSEAQMHADIQQVYDYLKQHYRESQIIVLGYSLGTGMATYLTAHNNPQRLVLVAPYVSMVHLKNRWLPFIPNFIVKYQLKSKDWISQIEQPITLFHGTEDDVIPFDSSKQLQALRPDGSQLISLQGEGHRGALFNPVFKRQLANILP